MYGRNSRGGFSEKVSHKNFKKKVFDMSMRFMQRKKKKNVLPVPPRERHWFCLFSNQENQKETVKMLDVTFFFS